MSKDDVKWQEQYIAICGSIQKLSNHVKCFQILMNFTIGLTMNSGKQFVNSLPAHYVKTTLHSA